jgi:hypothetical protein
MWRYHGVSRDDLFTNQAVIKVCCSTGEKTYFESLNLASKDAGISAAGLRNRVLTNVHRDDFHWIWDKTANHYHE